MTLRDPSGWPDGNPPERALVAHFAAMSPDELATRLHQVLDVAIDEVAPTAAVRAKLRDLNSGIGELPDDFDFAGGEWLHEAFGAARSSKRLFRVALENVRHAVAGAQAGAWAIVDYREFRRDPQAWKRRREVHESGDLSRRQQAATPERLQELANECRAAWLKVLECF